MVFGVELWEIVTVIGSVLGAIALIGSIVALIGLSMWGDGWS